MYKLVHLNFKELINVSLIQVHKEYAGYILRRPICLIKILSYIGMEFPSLYGDSPEPSLLACTNMDVDEGSGK